MIVTIKEINRETEEKFSIAAAKGGLFISTVWRALYGEQLRPYGIFDNDGRIIGGFCLYTSSKAGMSHYKTPPFSPAIGLFYENPSVNKANAHSYDKALLAELAEMLGKLPWKVLTIALPCGLNDTQPFIWKGFSVIPNYTYHIRLDVTEEELYANMSPDRRNSITRAQKDKVEVVECGDKQVIMDIVAATYARKSKSLNDDILKKILFGYAKPENSFAFRSLVSGKTSAACFCIYDNDTCYYLLGGYDKESKHTGAGSLALWSSILHARKLGLKRFDMEGSMIPEVEKYFRSFGGELVPYYTINKARGLAGKALKLLKPEQF